MDGDDGLDISGMPGGFPSSQPRFLYQVACSEGIHSDSCSTGSMNEDQEQSLLMGSDQAKSCG
jgi:hypothetical protein